MEIVRNCVSLSASAETVFAFITDPATAPLRMPQEVRDRYLAEEPLQEGDVRESTYGWLGIRWTERRWVVRVDQAARKVIWHTDSHFTLREEWRVEPLDEGRCRLVLERQLCPMHLGERLLWGLVTSWVMGRVMQRRLEMTRTAVEGGWRPRANLRTA